MFARFVLCALALSACLSFTSCGGGSPRVLESITVNDVSSASGTAYTATGHYSAAPMTVDNIQVAWFQTGPVMDPPGANWDYTMTTTPFKGACAGGPAQFYVVAYAPANPSAPASGSMPFSVFQTLVEQHSVTQDDGFVSGVGALSCTQATLRAGGPSPAAGF
jgi:hypothetical protein